MARSRDSAMVILTGGVDNRTSKPVPACDAFDVKEQAWKSLPDLNIARACHGSCQVGNHDLYVLGGYGRAGSANLVTAVIEVLDLRDPHQLGWEKIWSTEPLFSPRSQPVVFSPYNSRKIIILGGLGEAGEYLEDVVQYDVDKYRARKVANCLEACFADYWNRADRCMDQTFILPV